MKFLVQVLKKAEYLSAISMRLTKLTGKSKYPIHPKHLIPSKLWFEKDLDRTDTVLDLGCNAGQFSLKIAPKVKQVTGIDIDNKLIDIANRQAGIKKFKNIKFIVGDGNKRLPFKSEQFNKVICSDVLEHLEKRNFALNEIKRVLKPGGFLFLVTDNPDTSWKRLQKSVGIFYYADPEHKYEYPKEEILAKLKSLKFKVLSADPVTYDTPLKGVIDLVGGVSLSLYKRLRKWREYMAQRHPQDTTGYKIIAKKIK